MITVISLDKKSDVTRPFADVLRVGPSVRKLLKFMFCLSMREQDWGWQLREQHNIFKQTRNKDSYGIRRGGWHLLVNSSVLEDLNS